MYKIWMIFFLSLPLYATSVDQLRVNIVSIIATKLLPSSSIYVYTTNPDFKSIPWKKPIKRVHRCKDANLLILNNIDEMNTKCLKNAFVIMTDYQEYKRTPNAIGAIFWQKGRSQIVINAKKLKELSIKLGEQFEPYIE